MDSAIAVGAAPPACWLRDARFDLTFIFGVVVVALACAMAVMVEPALLGPILFANIWLLGHHHNVATMTRLCFTREDVGRYRFLLFAVPAIVAAAAIAAGLTAGFWILGTVYFYWQWFHYTRQSWGISRMYLHRSRDRAEEFPMLERIAFHLPPLWGILHRSWQDPGTFLGLELRTLPITEMVVDMVGAAAVLSLAWWAATHFMAWRRGRLVLGHTLYVASHHLIFLLGYVAIGDVTLGWVLLSVWHYLQYLLFVWLFNARRFQDIVAPRATFLSEISQPGQHWRYFAICFGISTLFFLLLQAALEFTPISAFGVQALVVAYMTINFHHYIVDGVVWKSAQKPGRLVPSSVMGGG
jgi:hypothetical protein